MAHSNGTSSTQPAPCAVYESHGNDPNLERAVEQLLQDASEAQREELARLLLFRLFNGVAGGRVLYSDEARRTPQFVIRYAGPPITEVVIDNSNLSPAAIAAIAKMNARS